jgi:predicted MFS family arabinose efflux permease
MDSRLFWLALAAFVGSMEGGLAAGLLPAISADMGVTTGQAGLLVLGYSLAYAIGTPLLAVMLGGVGRRRVLAGAELGLALCAVLIALAPVFPVLVAARTLLAVAAGTFTGTALAVAAMIAAPGQRGRALQTVTLGQSLANLVGVPLGALVAVHFSWRFDYGAIAVMAGAAALALYLGLPRGMHGDTLSIGARLKVLRVAGIVPALLTTVAMYVGSGAAGIYLGAVTSSVGLALDTLPLILLGVGSGAVLASVTGGRIADRFGNGPVITLSIIITAAGLSCFALLPLLPEGAPRLGLLMTLYLVQAYVAWVYWIAHCSAIAHLAPELVPVAISLEMSAYNLAIALAALAGGYVVDQYGPIAVALVGVPVTLAGLGVWALVPRRAG